MMDSIRCACGTHTKAACDFAGACGQRPADPLTPRGVVHQVHLSEVHSGFEEWGTAWRDCSEGVYNSTPEEHRRTLYTAPVAQEASQPEPKAAWIEQAVEACDAERVDADDTKAPEDIAYNHAIDTCITAIRATATNTNQLENFGAANTNKEGEA